MTQRPLVGVIMGSQSDWPETMKFAADTLAELGVSYEVNIVSAHRTPDRLFEYAKSAKGRGLKLIIAGAGGAAHLPGMVAALTPLPVYGVPVQSKALSGMDSLLSIAQMPAGIPVGTLAIGKSGAVNAAILAASTLAASGNHPDIEIKLDQFRAKQTAAVAMVPVDENGKTVVSTFSTFTASSEPSKPQPTATVAAKRRDVVIPPGGNIGIIGGGQLAKMSAIAAAYLGYKVWIYAPEIDPPASHACYRYVKANYDDEAALRRFAESVDVVTYEFENIPVFTLNTLDKYAPVRPKPQINAICQDRFKEKSFLESMNIPTAAFKQILNKEQLYEALKSIGMPSVLKSNNFGYDGKGQHTIRSETDVDTAWQVMNSVKSPAAILESFVNFEKEVSVIVGRSMHGVVKTFPVVENLHENHILKTTIVPAKVSEGVTKSAQDIATRIAENLDLVGIIAVEMFVTPEGQVLVNELAPRPHNSGHWSIEGAQTSQFQQHIRSICGLKLGDTSVLFKEMTMENLLGREVDKWDQVLGDKNKSLHLYGKDEAKEGRKMGHVTSRIY